MPETNRLYQLTPPGMAAIAVLRLVGPGVAEFLTSHFSRELKPGRCVHGELRDHETVLDDPVIVALPGGGADISLHGGPWVVQSVVELAKREGFEVVETDADGAAPLEAVDGATLLEREVQAYLPLARTELGMRVLLTQTAAWGELVRRATPGAGEESHLSRWLVKAEGIKGELMGILADTSLAALLHPPRVAIIGAPNVGKSTLANQLFAQERSITADQPGTTRDWVGEIANLDGLAVMLVDTPGIRATEDAIESEAIARSRGEIDGADLVVIVLDAGRALEGEQAAVMEAWPDALRVVNKSDAPAAWDTSRANGVRTVATLGRGVDALRMAIRARLGVAANMNEHAPRCWTARQRAVVEEAIGRVELLGRMLDG